MCDRMNKSCDTRSSNRLQSELQKLITICVKPAPVPDEIIYGWLYAKDKCLYKIVKKIIILIIIIIPLETYNVFKFKFKTFKEPFQDAIQ